jgi:acetyl esterase/lipase
MARDYISLSDCALKSITKSNTVKINPDNIIFSGHSKGAYVAGVAAGLAFKEQLALKPKAVMLFEPAGLDEEANSAVDKEVIYNVIYSDKDKVVDRKIAEGIFQQVPSSKKQFIFVKSYPELDAGHFWPLTKSSTFGGQNENAYHYFSAWKWLVALANDLKIGGLGSDHYLFGAEALNKGVAAIQDEITRSW